MTYFRFRKLMYRSGDPFTILLELYYISFITNTTMATLMDKEQILCFKSCPHLHVSQNENERAASPETLLKVYSFIHKFNPIALRKAKIAYNFSLSENCFSFFPIFCGYPKVFQQFIQIDFHYREPADIFHSILHFLRNIVSKKVIKYGNFAKINVSKWPLTFSVERITINPIALSGLSECNRVKIRQGIRGFHQHKVLSHSYYLMQEQQKFKQISCSQWGLNALVVWLP